MSILSGGWNWKYPLEQRNSDRNQKRIQIGYDMTPALLFHLGGNEDIITIQD